jgi:hypothetical protein
MSVIQKFDIHAGAGMVCQQEIGDSPSWLSVQLHSLPNGSG